LTLTIKRSEHAGDQNRMQMNFLVWLRRCTSFELKTSNKEQVNKRITIRRVVTFEDCQIVNRKFAEENMETTSSRNQFVAALTSELRAGDDKLIHNQN
jgi:hypothetical protein